MHHLSIDLETFSSVPIENAGAQKYIQSPDFEILLFAYSLDGAPVEVIDLARGERIPPWLVQAITSPDYIKHAYNAAFEWGCLSRYMGWLPVDQWRCTMLHALYCGYTIGLEATGKALGLPEDKKKLNTGKALIRYFCTPCTPSKANGGRTRNLPQHDPAKWELFREYNRQDAVTEMEIEQRLSALRDETGGRRFWVMDTDVIPRKKDIFTELREERDQIWAEAKTRWSVGEPLLLPPDLEIEAAKRQEQHRERHPWEDTIKNFLAQKIPADWNSWDLSRRRIFWEGGVTGDVALVERTKVCAREIWQEALGKDVASLDVQKARAINGVLNRLDDWERAGSLRFGEAYGVQKGYIKRRN